MCWKSWKTTRRKNLEKAETHKKIQIDSKSNIQNIKQGCPSSALGSDDFHSPERADLHPDILESADYSKMKAVSPSNPTIFPWSLDLNIWESIIESTRVLLRVPVSYFGNNQRIIGERSIAQIPCLHQEMQMPTSSKRSTLPTSAKFPKGIKYPEKVTEILLLFLTLLMGSHITKIQNTWASSSQLMSLLNPGHHGHSGPSVIHL